VSFAASHPLLELLGIELPLVQAPMAGVSTPELAAQVARAGALGSVALGASDVAGARALLASARELTGRPLNVNVFCHRPPRRDRAREDAWSQRLRAEFLRFGREPPGQLSEIYRSYADDAPMQQLVLEARPRVVSFHFGLPDSEHLQALRTAGTTLLGCATSVSEARSLERAGVHAIVAQGYEAGGHRGVFDPDAQDDRLGTMALTRLLVRELTVPVIAAGGIMDGAGIAAALRLGALAAQLGTAFLACPESQADEGYRAALASEAAHHTVVTRAISGRPARCLANRFTALATALRADEIPDYPLAYDAGKALNAAAKAAGDTRYGAQWAGQGAPLVRTLPAAALIGELRRELERA
jgi:nitronate monooxygenase